MPLPQQNTSTGVTQDTLALARSINPVRDPEDTGFITATLLNQQDTAEGSNVPPEQKGQYRIPIPGGFKATLVSGSGNIFQCTWQDIDPSFCTTGGYKIFAQLPTFLQPTQIGGSSLSPATVVIPGLTTANTAIPLWLQPFLSNGLTLPLTACPTVTVLASPGNITGATITGATIIGGTISGGTITGETITASTMTTSTLTSNTISSNTISSNTISGNTITGGTISATTISASTISGNTISGGSISGTTISGGTLSISDGTVTAIVDTVRPIGGGVTQAGLGVYYNAHTANTTTIVPEGLVAFNQNGNVAASISQTGGAGAHGILVAYDGTGTGGLSTRGDTVHVDGSGGFVQIWDVGAGQWFKIKGLAGTPGTGITNAVVYIVCEFYNGSSTVTYYLPLAA